MLISSLAKKICARKGINPAQLRGTGPRGRIMAQDVVTPSTAPTRRGQTAFGDPSTPPTRPQKEGYYVYDACVNMKALADISLPIAVQCEKLVEQRYSLFDYIVRAVIKACCSNTSWQDPNGKVDVLLFEQKGQKIAGISDARNKTIFRIARETQAGTPLPADFAPHIVICDAETTRRQVEEHLSLNKRPGFALLVRGRFAKVGIRAGGKNLPNQDLNYTFYVSGTLPEEQANRIAARLQHLLYSPVSLLLLS